MLPERFLELVRRLARSGELVIRPRDIDNALWGDVGYIGLQDMLSEAERCEQVGHNEYRIEADGYHFAALLAPDGKPRIVGFAPR